MCRRSRTFQRADSRPLPTASAAWRTSRSRAVRARRRQYQSRRVLEQREQELRHRDRFMAMLGHELRNPLSAIASAVRIPGMVAGTGYGPGKDAIA